MYKKRNDLKEVILIIKKIIRFLILLNELILFNKLRYLFIFLMYFKKLIIFNEKKKCVYYNNI